MSKEQLYNSTITEETLDRTEALNPTELNILDYGRPSDICQGIKSGRLGNMAGGFPFHLFGVKWYGTEFLYLCGEWSLNDEKSLEIQNYIRTQKSGAWVYRCAKSKYSDYIRPDFPEFRHQWMLWCVWQKCVLNETFAHFLKSIPEDVVIVEKVKRDPIWAAWPDENGIIRGGNAMGKILTICRRHLLAGTQPDINRELLNKAGIYILGNKVEF